MRDEKWRHSGNDSGADTRMAESKMTFIERSLLDGGQTATRWRKIRGGFLLGLGCITSPCCTPLIVPAALVLLAGTPLAAFLTRYAGWVYAVLTLISLASLFLGTRRVWPSLFAQRKKPSGSTLERALAQESQDISMEMEA